MTVSVSSNHQFQAREAARQNRRKGVIAKIHVAKKQLDMDEDSYRAVLLRITERDSLTDCTMPQLDAVVREMERLGFKPRKPAAAKPAEARKLDQSSESSKIRALWLLLHELGAVKNPAEGALASYCKRITGIDDLAWLNDEQRERMIETLKKWAVRIYPSAMRPVWEKLHAAGLMPAFSDHALAHYIAQCAPRAGRDRSPSFETMQHAHQQLLSLLPKEGR